MTVDTNAPPDAAGLRCLALAQGAFYLASGLWPLLHMRSFTAVTGPKRDLWLVRTVGVLVTVIGSVLLASGRRRQPPVEVALLASGSAAALGGIDVWYSLRGVIAKVYLLDALAEAALAGAWIVLWRRRPHAPGAG